jgi:hypothetical protein
MPLTEQYTYYDGAKFEAPTPPLEETVTVLSRALKLDAKLETAFEQDASVSTTFFTLQIKRYLAEIQRTFQTVKETDVFYAVVKSVCDWLILSIRSLDLTDEEKTTFHDGFFSGIGLGKSGLSMVVEMCSMLICEQLNITSLSFSRGNGVPRSRSEIDAWGYTHRGIYNRLYTKDGEKLNTVFLGERADAYVRCSYPKFSISVIQKMKEISSSLDQADLIQDEPERATEKEEKYLSRKLKRGVKSKKGLIYSLAKKIST